MVIIISVVEKNVPLLHPEQCTASALNTETSFSINVVN